MTVRARNARRRREVAYGFAIADALRSSDPVGAVAELRDRFAKHEVFATASQREIDAVLAAAHFEALHVSRAPVTALAEAYTAVCALPAFRQPHQRATMAGLYASALTRAGNVAAAVNLVESLLTELREYYAHRRYNRAAGRYLRATIADLARYLERLRSDRAAR